MTLSWRSQLPGGRRPHWCERQGGCLRPPPEGTALHSASSSLSEKRPPPPRGLSLPARVAEDGGSARLDSEKESGKGQAALLLVCSGSAVHLPSPGAVTGRQPPPAGARCQSQDAGGGKGDAAAPGGGWTAGGQAERRRGPPRPREGRGWLHRWAGGTQRLTRPAKTRPLLVPRSFLGDKAQSEASTVIILNLLCFK